jgi:hypothetical protein
VQRQGERQLLAAAAIQAIKAAGVVVRMEPNDFLEILQRQKDPLVVHAVDGIFRTHYQYLATYKGLAFFTKTSVPLNLPYGVELVQARSISMPGA